MISLFYFSITLQPVDRILFEFDFDQMEMIAGDFVVFKWYYLILFVLPPLYWITFRHCKSKKLSAPVIWTGLIFFILSLFFGVQVNSNQYLHSKLGQNKTYYFFSSFMTAEHEKEMSLASSIRAFQKNEGKSFSSVKHPLLYEASNLDPLEPFFNLQRDSPPNFVFIIVESLSSSFSGRNATEISYTPFLDSLSDHSIYFENALATGERTFAVLPSILGSLPHGRKGFTHQKHGYPKANSLLKWLIQNGYHSTFNYGGHARFDYMDLFLKEHELHEVYDREEFNYEGTSVKTSIDPVPFGISDRDLMSEVYERQKNRTLSPYIDIVLTLSSHYPFVVEDQKRYIKQVRTILNQSGANNRLIKKHKKYLKEFSTLKYTDDVLKNYFKKRKTSKDHDNTIYVILGDHMMTDIPHPSNLEKYRSPMMIYSPLLKRTKRIKAVNSHLDVAPSFYQLLKEKYPFDALEYIHWIGEPFDTVASFQSQRTLLFMRNERQYKDFLHKDQFISEGESFNVNTKLNIEESKVDEGTASLMRAYKKIHVYTVVENMIIPENKGQIFAKGKTALYRLNDSTEFQNIFIDSLPTDYNAISVTMNLSLDQGWVKSNELIDESQPLLIFTLKRGEETYFWKRIDLELIDKPIESPRRINFNIRNNLEFNMVEGDQISIYFWNTSGEQTTFNTIIHNIELHGNE